MTALLILDLPIVADPRQRRLHTAECRWAHRPGGRPERTYRVAKPAEVRTHKRCGFCS